MKKDANIPEDDWKKTWNPGTYDYLAPGYVPGTHEIERGEVTWHQLRVTSSLAFWSIGSRILGTTDLQP